MQRYYSSQWEVRSLSDRRDENGNVLEYKVSRRATGEYQCSCKAWIYQRKRLHNGRLIPREELEWFQEIPNGHCKIC